MTEELKNLYVKAYEKLEFILDDIQKDYKKERNLVEHKISRIKTDTSILDKLERKKINDISDKSIKENINDIVGARIVCPFLNDIYKIRDKLMTRPELLPIDEKDFITNPKESGYRSYHLRFYIKVVDENNEEQLVKVEIQLRTILMDMWASLEHKIHYKKRIKLSETTNNRMKELSNKFHKYDVELDQKKTDEREEENQYNILTDEEYDRLTQKYRFVGKQVYDIIKNLQESFQNKENDIKKENKDIDFDIEDINPIVYVEKRIKPSKSLLRKVYNKMQEGPIVSVEDAINDIAGVRIVCSFKRDLFKLVDIIENNLGFEVIKELGKDYVHYPKENGYSGYRIVVSVPYYHEDGSVEKVKVEIQIRTIAMDMWAIVERNLRYKNLTDEERNNYLELLAQSRDEFQDDMENVIEEVKELQNIHSKKLVLKR